jgi:PST family polysaccharide transporter
MGGAGLGINMLLLLYIHYQLNIKFYKPKFIQLFTSLHENGLLFLSNLASHISINGGLIILSFFSTAEILGMFSLAERISMVLRIFPSLVIQAIYPNASRLLQSDLPQFIRFIKKVYGISLLLGLLGSLTTFILAPFIIQVLSKTELEESVIFMKILAFLPFLACLNIANVIIFLVKDQKNLMFKSSWLMFIYMISASLILTSQFGALGLCYALLSTEVIVLLISTVLNWIYNKPLVLSIARTF